MNTKELNKMLKKDLVAYAQGLQELLASKPNLELSTLLSIYSYNNGYDGSVHHGGQRFKKASMKIELSNGFITYTVRWICPSGMGDGNIDDIRGEFKPDNKLLIEINKHGLFKSMTEYFDLPDHVYGYIRENHYGNLRLKHQNI